MKTNARKATQKKPAARRSATKRTPRAAPSRSRRANPDAVSLLKADHARVDAMFKRYESARSNQKEALVKEICEELKMHTLLEEELFYPELRAAAKRPDGAGDLLDEAKVEHHSAKMLIAELEAGSPGDELFDAKVKVLGEYIRHHVKEEHNEIFPLARQRLDLVALGERMAIRKQQMAMSPPVRLASATKSKVVELFRR